MNQEPLQRIHKNAIKAWRTLSLLLGLLWFIPSAFYLVMEISVSTKEAPWYSEIDWILLLSMFLIALILYVAFPLIFPKIRWQRWKYEVSDEGIDMLRGIIIKKRTMVPINRVQHVDTRQGPIYRKYDLASVTISTAATTHEIPALDNETADELRNTISTLVRKIQSDV
ncbi:PH domain-containing protein [Gracilimonas sp.]|uniref:PH domain-containing protein n=1 Tax=Gracilimonas sp. TaxID=1974203 RepID=UPI002871E743|nr:PH domain-containing protein [Gracilimonas sp.]